MSRDNNGPRLDDEGHFDRCMGHALSWWNHVENDLGDVFCALFGGINNLAARGAYLAVVNFNARLKMVDAAASASSLPPELITTWRRLRNKVDKKSAIRNKLTHYSRVRSKTAKGQEAIFLLPNFWNSEEWVAALSGEGTRWTWPEIWNFGQEFGKLAIQLNQLAGAIETHRRAQPLVIPQSVPDPIPPHDAPNGL